MPHLQSCKGCSDSPREISLAPPFRWLQRLPAALQGTHRHPHLQSPPLFHISRSHCITSSSRTAKGRRRPHTDLTHTYTPHQGLGLQHPQLPDLSHSMLARSKGRLCSKPADRQTESLQTRGLYQGPRPCLRLTSFWPSHRQGPGQECWPQAGRRGAGIGQAPRPHAARRLNKHKRAAACPLTSSHT